MIEGTAKRVPRCNVDEDRLRGQGLDDLEELSDTSRYPLKPIIFGPVHHCTSGDRATLHC